MVNSPGGPEGPALQAAPPTRSVEPRAPGRRAVVGASSAMRGQLSAREDVWIEGQFEGELQAPAHQVTVSPGGRVRAEVKAHTVIVEGELFGNVVAEQIVMVRAGGRMQGDIRAPRVGLEEGCQFQGNVDMDGTQTTGAPAAQAAAAAPAATATADAAAATVVVGKGGD